MLRNWFFWVCVVVVLVALFLFGCDDDGRIPTRFAATIDSGGDGVSHAWLCYRDHSGNLVEQDGIRIDRVSETAYVTIETSTHTYEFYPTAATRIDGDPLTGEGGRLNLYGWREWNPRSGRLHTAGVEYRNPRDSFSSVQSTFLTRDYGTSILIGMSPSGNSVPQWDRPATAALNGNLTQDEFNILSLDDVPLPSSGIDYSCSLVQQCGNNGIGYTKVMGGLVPFSFLDTETILRYASPMMYSYTVTTATAITMIGDCFSAKIKTNATPSGFPIEITVVAENEEKTVHIARTEYFLPVDAESYAALDSEEIYVYDRWTPADEPNSLDTSDPNFLEFMQEDRVMPCTIIPIGDTDELRIEFVPGARAFIKAAPSWLTGDKTFDINNDDIVNFTDWFF